MNRRNFLQISALASAGVYTGAAFIKKAHGIQASIFSQLKQFESLTQFQILNAYLKQNELQADLQIQFSQSNEFKNTADHLKVASFNHSYGRLSNFVPGDIQTDLINQLLVVTRGKDGSLLKDKINLMVIGRYSQQVRKFQHFTDALPHCWYSLVGQRFSRSYKAYWIDNLSRRPFDLVLKITNFEQMNTKNYSQIEKISKNFQQELDGSSQKSLDALKAIYPVYDFADFVRQSNAPSKGHLLKIA